MGQVYQATDTKLNRQVALKILPEAFAADPDRLARFQREAQVLASLNHPNIAQIHGLEESDGTRALVLELVEGPTLADRISKGPLPLDAALPIAKQIAEALEAAHEAGVIHRDLKPANIKVKDDGTVKVLDFGLAKALEATGGDPAESPTLTAAATQMGVILGTAAYMSPEQASGETTDKRSDIWSFGVVLFEMLTGQRLFTGKTVSHVLAKVLERPFDFAQLPTSTPPAVRRLLRRCLERDAKRRLRDVNEAVIHLEEAATLSSDELVAPSAPAVVPQRHAWQRPVPALFALLLAVVAGLGSWALTRSAPAAEPDVMRFTIIPAAPLRLPGAAHDLAISRDGTQIVYQSDSGQLNLRPIDQLSDAPLRGAEQAGGPFLSPDGLWVGFSRAGGTTLQRVSVLGGAPVTLAELPSGVTGASWGLDDQIIVGTFTGGLLRIPGGGGEPEVLTTPDAELSESHRWPVIIPRREAVLFAIGSTSQFVTGAELAVLELDTGAVTRLGLAGVSPHYVSTGHVVYATEDGSLRAVSFDAGTLSVTGSPVPLVESIPVKVTGAADFDLSDNGRLVYVPTLTAADQTSSLVVAGRDGAGTTLAEGRAYYPRFSPDGTRVAYAVAQAPGANTEADVWVLDVERGTRTRLTSGGNNSRFYPVWSPDGARLAYSETRATRTG